MSRSPALSAASAADRIESVRVRLADVEEQIPAASTVELLRLRATLARLLAQPALSVTDIEFAGVELASHGTMPLPRDSARP